MTYVKHFSINRLLLKLIVNIFILNLVGCATLCDKFSTSNSPPSNLHDPIQKESTNKEKKKVDQISWIELLSLSISERKVALQEQIPPLNEKDILKRSILLTHDQASLKDLIEAEKLLHANFITPGIKNAFELSRWRETTLKLNKAFQAHQLEVANLQQQLAASKRKFQKQKQDNKILERKIEALTDIEHQINLRLDKNIL